jgi:hypothetical protein
VKISSDELLPPFGAGNPLAAALRATRDHIIRIHPDEGRGRDTEPYALILVRPSGLMMFSRARAAIEAGDFDLGYELVEADWKLKYPAADLALADLQQQAIHDALARQQLLAAAAPRAYRHPALVAAGQFDDEDEVDEPIGRNEAGGYVVREKESAAGDEFGEGDAGYGGSGSGGGFPGGGGGRSANGSATAGGATGGAVVGTNSQNAGPAGGGPPADESAGQIAGAGGGSPGCAGPSGGKSAVAAGAASGDMSGIAGVTGQAAGSASGSNQAAGGAMPTAGSSAVTGAGGAAGGNSAGTMSRAEGAGGVPMSSDPDAQPQLGNISVMTGTPPPDAARGGTTEGASAAHAPGRGSLAQSKGKDWALGKKPPRAVPIRRTIHVVVRHDQIAILSDNASPTINVAGGTAIPMRGDTVEAVEEFVTHVHKCVDGWGIAGDGLYWRPVLVLTVAPDGQRRADDLARLLKNSGLEIRSGDTAQSNRQGQTK